MGASTTSTSTLSPEAAKKLQDEDSEFQGTLNIPFSIFTSTSKYLITIMASVASLISPMSSNIYLTALNPIAEDLHVSDSKVNLTITTFMIFQGISPVFIATCSDAVGRRPAFLVCFALYIAANIGLALQSNYGSLIGLRCLQSAGSSPTIALASAVAVDIAASKQRGSFLGVMLALQIIGPTVAPVAGGLLTSHLGWHAIFWFLSIAAVVLLIPMVLFFPETSRNVVHDGSTPPPWWNRSIKQMLCRNRHWKSPELSVNKETQLKNPLPILRVILTDPESLMILLIIGQSYSGIYSLMTTIPSLMYSTYGYNSEQIGYLFLAWSAGTVISTFTTGTYLDWVYRREARRMNLDPETDMKDFPDFPIEKARLQFAIPVLAITGATIITYGWLLEYNYPVAFVYCFELIFGFWSSSVCQVGTTLLMDLHPGFPAAAGATVNLVRCLLGAGVTACALPLLHKIGKGWFHTFAGAVWVWCGIPMVWWVIRNGVQLRKRRDSKSA
ncbi:unnamed protein product [Penicillium salamii]|uniref:Citrate exporter 1 n=1 Tax=Penicillium salamii TaxID=1612424 RepID=A0A9W4N9M4_9EURO|nr:unnamed protein product [Penicillium salamii]CAG8072491.1 unnamed protein product [Penicillium salamii]CAG8249072.1 unnamed protein product [Penicillium salamii]CAG8249794.1 unnamed protein product [Penicillium salamii]CAG8301550.1 unnamed protein product [Penicillium salamii]